MDAVADRISQSAQPAVAQILETARRMERNGVELTYLLRGEPDFDTPTHVCRAAIEALRAGFTHYAPTRGIPELRRAISQRLLRDYGLDVDADEEVLITEGATMGLYVAIQAVVDPGDEVIILSPVYDPYPVVVRMAAGVPILVAAEEHNGHFRFSEDLLENAVTQNTKAILINNPWNPTGTVMTEDELGILVDVAERHDLVLISDEIYESIVFDDKLFHNLASLCPRARKRTITINSFSKTYAMTGWRLGYNVAPPDLTGAMLRITEQFSRSATTFVQHAGAAALNGPQDVVKVMADAYARRRSLVTKNLRAAGITSFHPPEGTFFIFLDIRPFKMSSRDMAFHLMENARVVTVPGSMYGPAGEGFIRMSFAYNEENLLEGIRRICGGLSRL